MAFQIAPDPKKQFFDDNGFPLTGGKVYSYLAGSNTAVDTYTDSSGQTANTNPVILDARGEADIWLSQSLVYKLVLTDENDVEIWSVDNISVAGGSGGGGGGSDEFVKVSGTDVASQYLVEKIAAGAGITVNVLNSGGVEQLEIVADGEGIPASLVDGAFVLKNIDGSYLVTDNASAPRFVWDSANAQFLLDGSQLRMTTPLVLSDTSIITLDDAAGANHSIYTGTDNLIIQSDGVGGIVLQSTNGIATSSAVDLNGTTDTQSGSLLAKDPTLAQEVATKNYVDNATPATPNLQEVTDEGATTTQNITVGTNFTLSNFSIGGTDLLSLLVSGSSFALTNINGGGFVSENISGNTIRGGASGPLRLGSGADNLVDIYLDPQVDKGSSYANLRGVAVDTADSNRLVEYDIPAQGVSSFYSQTFQEADLVGRNLTITHNLDSEDLILNLFDADKKVYLPDEYQVTDSNTVVVTIDATVVGINKIIVCGDAQSASGNTQLGNRVVVNQANVSTTLGGTIDSDKEYFIDGQIDMGTLQITVPASGMTLTGYNFDLSALYSSEPNYTMFVSDVGGSGNVLGRDYEIRVTGTNSQVYDLTDATGFNAFEFARVNYTDCTSLGTITNYRQGLENGTGRFGGSPSLTLEGTWLGGYRITTSIVRSMSDTTTEPLFKAGASFTMASRFATDMNVDLGTLQPLLDFDPANFPNPSTLQLQEMILTRDGVLDPTDTNITPNIDQMDLASYWKRNVGLANTYVGGTASVIAEAVTTVSLVNTWYDLAGTFLGTGLEHFSANAAGELTHDGVSPREFEFTGSLIIEGSANRSLSFRFNKWDNSAGAFTPLDYTIQTRTVANLVGGRDVALFNIAVGGTLDQNDYLKLQVRNNTDTSNVTLESSSYYRVQER